MGKATKAVRQFILSIPDCKFEAISTKIGTIYKDINFRLDMQGMTSDDPANHNLQVQINNRTRISTLKSRAPLTIAIAIVPADTSATKIRTALLNSIA
ncbi:hypothetical protein TWF706_009820 [Orbilia oligospora]|nr:hypothetical protein TWF706_009820 [Orbilia oligospora]KAF3091841.1 hypothetical protein TWF103_011403 [Orbilia oligospora]